jgi:hypothetical protein
MSSCLSLRYLSSRPLISAAVGMSFPYSALLNRLAASPVPVHNVLSRARFFNLGCLTVAFLQVKCKLGLAFKAFPWASAEKEGSSLSRPTLRLLVRGSRHPELLSASTAVRARSVGSISPREGRRQGRWDVAKRRRFWRVKLRGVRINPDQSGRCGDGAEWAGGDERETIRPMGREERGLRVINVIEIWLIPRMTCVLTRRIRDIEEDRGAFSRHRVDIIDQKPGID